MTLDSHQMHDATDIDRLDEMNDEEREAWLEWYDRERLPELRRQSQQAIQNLGRIVEQMRAQRLGLR